MPRSSLVWLWPSLLGFAPIAIAQDKSQMPSDAELRTAYCIPVITRELSDTKQAAAEAEQQANDPVTASYGAQDKFLQVLAQLKNRIAELDSALKRLEAYLLPRRFQRDPVALAAAQKRGEADYQELMGGECAARCMAVANANLTACLSSCNPPDLVARLKACKDPTWLPF
jgi:hypothetical protein